MSIPGGSVKNRKPPMLRDGVGGSIKAINAGHSFNPAMIIKAIEGDEDMFFHSPIMYGVNWSLSGITKDSGGAVLGSCLVHLFYTSSDAPISQQVSDASTGAFSFNISPSAGPFYFVAYKPGSPDVAGTTINTLLPVAV